MTVKDNNGCTSLAATTSSATVYALPIVTATVSPVTVCAGATLSLNATASSGSGTYSNYYWSGPSSYAATGTVSTMNIASVSATAAGIYSVTVKDSHGCISASASTASVTVN